VSRSSIAARSPLGLLALSVLALGAARSPESEKHTLQSGGRERSYRLYVPTRIATGAPAALVLVFHGGRGDGAGMERLTGFDAIADRDGFLVAYPDGVGRQWNDGRDVAEFQTTRDRVDDVAFVSELIDEIARRHPVDSKRVFATGISNGAIFSHYLGARLASRIAAIAPIAGGIAEPYRPRFRPERPVSVLMMNGSDDPLVPYRGGPVGGTHGRVLGADESAALWAAADQCSKDPKTDTLPDSDPKDGCRVKRELWPGGREGTEVQLYRFDGGGHTWPGGPQYLPKLVIGAVCRDVDATPVIWAFFRAHPRA
jgi:polyhydroxybutyrate depolymerase